MISFGERLSRLRNEKGLSQQDLADRINVSKSSIGMYETNKREPDFETLEKIANLFDVTTDYLLGRNSNSTVVDDPEWNELHEKIKQKGAELEATAMLRTASKMNKNQLKDILKVFEMIANDED